MRYYPGEQYGNLVRATVYYVRTGEFRLPLKGEYYLSGAIPMAYRAPNDLPTAYEIMRPVPNRRIAQRRKS